MMNVHGIGHDCATTGGGIPKPYGPLWTSPVPPTPMPHAGSDGMWYGSLAECQAALAGVPLKQSSNRSGFDGLKSEIERLTFERDRYRSHVPARTLAGIDRIAGRQANRQCTEPCEISKLSGACIHCGFGPTAVNVRPSLRRRAWGWAWRAGLILFCILSSDIVATLVRAWRHHS